MDSLLDGLAERRELIANMFFTATGYLLERRLVDDGGGTAIETFEYRGITFGCRLQSNDRRPDDGWVGHTGNSIIEMAGMQLVYPTNISIGLDDRVQINTRVYAMRNPLDNIDDAMTNRMFVSELPGVVTSPPTLVS